MGLGWAGVNGGVLQTLDFSPELTIMEAQQGRGWHRATRRPLHPHNAMGWPSRLGGRPHSFRAEGLRTVNYLRSAILGLVALAAFVRVLAIPRITVLLICLVQGQEARAATIAVTTTDDELNADGDCSLREAIRAFSDSPMCSGRSGQRRLHSR